jgi:hypothetical protein
MLWRHDHETGQPGTIMLEGHTELMERLGQLGQLRVIGFEPQPAECENLNALAQPGRQHRSWAATCSRTCRKSVADCISRVLSGDRNFAHGC